MNYYLVDYENVKSHGLDGIVKMSEEDVVSIFYSENADTMTFSLHQKLNETRANVIYEKVEVGTKNALDFQLVTELGYLIRDMQDQAVNFYIVSKDKGYGNTVTYWKKRGVSIAQVIDVSGLDEEKIENDLKAKVEPLVRDKDVVDKVVKMILQYKTKQGINNALMKEFPSSNNKRASEIYAAIKPLLSDKKGTVSPAPEAPKAEEKPGMPQSRFERRTDSPQWHYEKRADGVVKITEKPETEKKPAEKPAEKAAEKPAEKPAETPAEKPAEAEAVKAPEAEPVKQPEAEIVKPAEAEAVKAEKTEAEKPVKTEAAKPETSEAEKPAEAVKQPEAEAVKQPEAEDVKPQESGAEKQQEAAPAKKRGAKSGGRRKNSTAKTAEKAAAETPAPSEAKEKKSRKKAVKKTGEDQ